jgi:predicted RecA/RadA family phage recombinase
MGFGKMVFIISLLISMVLGLSYSAFGASLNLGEATGTPGTDVIISVTLVTGGAQISAVASDIGYNTSLLENPRVAIGPAGSAAGKEVNSSTPSTGVFRIMVVGLNNNAIGDGIVAYLTFAIKSTATPGDTPLNNIPTASDPYGNPVTISGTNGVIHCQQQPPAQLNLGSGSGSPGGTVTLPITLVTNGWNICATSNDLQYDASLLKSPTCEIGPAGSAASKGVQCNVVATGIFRVGVVGLNTNSIGDGVVAYVTFGIDQSATPGSKIAINNTPTASDCAGGLVPITGTDGEVDVCALSISPSAFPSVFGG